MVRRTREDDLNRPEIGDNHFARVGVTQPAPRGRVALRNVLTHLVDGRAKGVAARLVQARTAASQPHRDAETDSLTTSGPPRIFRSAHRDVDVVGRHVLAAAEHLGLRPLRRRERPHAQPVVRRHPPPRQWRPKAVRRKRHRGDALTKELRGCAVRIEERPIAVAKPEPRLPSRRVTQRTRRALGVQRHRERVLRQNRRHAEHGLVTALGLRLCLGVVCERPRDLLAALLGDARGLVEAGDVEVVEVAHDAMGKLGEAGEPGPLVRALDQAFFHAMCEDVADAVDEGLVIEDGLCREAPVPEPAVPSDEVADAAGDVGLDVGDEGEEVDVEEGTRAGEDGADDAADELAKRAP